MKEIRMQEATIEEIRQAILGLRNSEEVITIRGGAKTLGRDDWGRILQRDVGLAIDQRQYNFDHKLELVDWWEISYQPERAISYAYSDTRQPLHNDNAWFSDPAEVNFFIMEKQARSGGEQFIYPLSRLLEDLSSEEPALFTDLCQTKVVIKKGDGEYFNHSTIIVLEGEPRIFWNFYRTEKPTAEISSMCDAFFRYLEKKEGTASVQRRRSESGDCMAFNDQKILHGRAAFSASKPYDRVLWQSMWRLPKVAS